MKNIIFTALFALYLCCYFANAEDKLTSNSFEITNLSSDLSGYYMDYTLDENVDSKMWLKSNYIIKNISGTDLQYRISIECLSMNENHILEHCIAGSCYMVYYPTISGWINSTWTSGILNMNSNFVSNPNIDSYIGISAGETISTVEPGIDMFKITYRNISDINDFITFTATWDFTTTSISIIKDMSNSVFPIPATNNLNFTCEIENIDNIEIYDIKGSKIMNVAANNNNIDISQLQAGNYIGFFVKNGTKTGLFKFVVK